MRFLPVGGAVGSPWLAAAVYHISTTAPSRPRTSVEHVTNPIQYPEGHGAVPLVVGPALSAWLGPSRAVAGVGRTYTRSVVDYVGRSATACVGVSVACWAGVFITLGERGISDWSRALVVLFYTALALAFVTGILGMVLTLCSSLPKDKKRLLAALSLPGILCPVWILLAVISLASEAAN
jgi:hypothetical protein